MGYHFQVMTDRLAMAVNAPMLPGGIEVELAVKTGGE
jgi:hypothetical protein